MTWRRHVEISTWGVNARNGWVKVITLLATVYFCCRSWPGSEEECNLFSFGKFRTISWARCWVHSNNRTGQKKMSPTKWTFVSPFPTSEHLSNFWQFSGLLLLQVQPITMFTTNNMKASRDTTNILTTTHKILSIAMHWIVSNHKLLNLFCQH